MTVFRLFFYCPIDPNLQMLRTFLVIIKAQGLTVLGSGFLLFLNVTYEAMEEESGTGDLVLGGTIPTG